MKRKWLFVLIPVTILGLCIIVIWPMTPIWQKLGVEPKCIQGKWPNLRLVSCPSQQRAVVTPMQLPTTEGSRPVPIIVDDDGSPDGMVALLYFLSNPLFEVKAVTISCGEAHPELFAPHVQRLLTGLGKAYIPVGEGRATPLEGNNSFPDPWREASDNFWSIDYPRAPVLLDPVPAAQLIVDTVKNSPQPVMIFVSGTHTNLAEALRLDPGITGNIRNVQVMGGAIHIPGNIKSDWPEIDNNVAEWNIWVDPVAANVVFASGLPIHLTPLDATDQVLWTEADAQTWTSSRSPEGNLAGQLLQWMLKSWSVKSVYIWDLVAAINATDPALCPQVRFAVDVLTAPGLDQGQTMVNNKGSNVTACLEPDSAQMKALAVTVFGP